MSQPYRIGKLQRQRSDGSRYWHWCIKWVDAAGPHRISLGTTDRNAADTAARRFWNQRTLGHTDSIGAIVTRHFESGECNDLDRKRQRWSKMEPFWGGLTIRDIDKQTPKAYAEWRGKSTNTIRNELSLIKAACRWAMEDVSPPIITALPVIKLPPMPKSKVGHLTKDQFRHFLSCCVMPHVKLFAILAVSTGARKTALLTAKWAYLDWERCLLDLSGDAPVPENKGRAIVALHGLAMDALREAKAGALSEYIIEVSGGPIKDIKKGIRLTAQRAGLHVHPHMFRHSAAVWMAEDRVPMSEIAAFLGHNNTATTEKVYARYHPDYLKRASKSLEW